MQFFKRTMAPLLRVTTMQDVPHEPVFQSFVQNVGRALVDECVRREPRIVLFERRRGGV